MVSSQNSTLSKTNSFIQRSANDDFFTLQKESRSTQERRETLWEGQTRGESVHASGGHVALRSGGLILSPLQPVTKLVTKLGNDGGNVEHEDEAPAPQFEFMDEHEETPHQLDQYLDSSIRSKSASIADNKTRRRMESLYEGAERDDENDHSTPTKLLVESHGNFEMSRHGSLEFAQAASPVPLSRKTKYQQELEEKKRYYTEQERLHAVEVEVVEGRDENDEDDEDDEDKKVEEERRGSGFSRGLELPPPPPPPPQSQPQPQKPKNQLQQEEHLRLTHTKEADLLRLKTKLTSLKKENSAAMNALLSMVYKLNVAEQRAIDKEAKGKENARKVLMDKRRANGELPRNHSPGTPNCNGRSNTRSKVVRRSATQRPTPRRASVTSSGGQNLHREWTSHPVTKSKTKTNGVAQEKLQPASEVDKFLRQEALEEGRKLWEEDFGSKGKYGKKLFLVESMEKAKKAVGREARAKRQVEAERAGRLNKDRGRNRTDSYYHAVQPDVFEGHGANETVMGEQQIKNISLHSANAKKEEFVKIDRDRDRERDRRVSFGANTSATIISETDMAEFQQFLKLKNTL